MSPVEKTNTHGRTRLSFASVADIDEFVATLEKYERGEMTPEEWRGFRLVRGTYGQRQAEDAQMLRVKVPQGVLTRAQLDSAAHRVDPDDLALLAMLVDRASPADVAATLRIDRRRVAKRIERVIGRLRSATSSAAA